MTLRVTRYEVPATMKPTRSETDILHSLAEESCNHTSGGSYNMLAQWRKGSRVATGRNRLNRPASTLSDDYPELCGIHAELSLFHLVKPRGGTVYVAGTRATGDRMPNTAPCVYCMAILSACNIRSTVFYLDDKPVKLWF